MSSALPPETITRLLALPSLREQAERDAQDHHTALIAAMVKANGSCSFSLAIHPALIEAAVSLLADLTRWQSQAWALREIGRLLGWRVGHVFIRSAGIGWRIESLSGPDWKVKYFNEYGLPTVSPSSGVPDESKMPAALAAILLHLSESR